MPGDISFWTSAHPIVSDVLRIFNAIDRLFGVFHALSIIDRRMREGGESRLTDYLMLSYPRLRLDEAEDRSGWQAEPFRLRVAAGLVESPHVLEKQYFDFVFANRHRLAPSEGLRIVSVLAFSPVQVKLTLEGSGEILQQFRELWKDLRFRNRQEREAGEIELMRKKLELCRDFISPAAMDMIVLEAADHAGEISRLEERGLLSIEDPPIGIMARSTTDMVRVRLDESNDDHAPIFEKLSNLEIAVTHLAVAARRHGGYHEASEWADEVKATSLDISAALNTMKEENLMDWIVVREVREKLQALRERAEELASTATLGLSA